MTTSQIFNLMSDFEYFLVISVLNILLTIWILIRIKRNHQDIAAIKNLLGEMHRHKVTTFKPIASLSKQDVQPDPQAPKHEPKTFAGNTKNSEIGGFIKALKEGTDINEATRQFHLTEDEANVAMVSYRTATNSDEKSDPIF